MNFISGNVSVIKEIAYLFLINFQMAFAIFTLHHVFLYFECIYNT